MAEGIYRLDPDSDESKTITGQDTGTPPHISPKTRTGFYFGVLMVNVATALVCGLGPILGYMSADQAIQVTGVVTGALGTLSAGLALGYRPTRPAAGVSGG